MNVEKLRLAWLNVWTLPFQLLGYLLGFSIKVLKLAIAAVQVNYTKGRDI